MVKSKLGFEERERFVHLRPRTNYRHARPVMAESASKRRPGRILVCEVKEHDALSQNAEAGQA
jgi:hypothetical protein